MGVQFANHSFEITHLSGSSEYIEQLCKIPE